MSPSSTSRVGRVHGRRSFAALRQTGTRHRSGPIMITSIPRGDADPVRVAYAIPKAVGPAVVRNRLRRRLRAVVRELPWEPGDHLISAGPRAAELTFDQLRAHVASAARR